MPASKQVDLSGITAAVTRAKGVMASAKTLIQSQGTATAEAVRAALEADNVTDDNFVDIAVAAVNGVTAELDGAVDDLSTALTAPGGGGPPTA